MNESFRKEYKTFLRKLPWYPAEQTVSRNGSRNRNGIELPQLRRQSRSLNEHRLNDNHPQVSKAFQERLGIKSRSCCTINNIDDRDYDMRNGHVMTINGIEKTRNSNHLLVPTNHIIPSSEHNKSRSLLNPKSRSLSIATDSMSFEILPKNENYNSVIINVPSITTAPGNKSTTTFSSPRCCLQGCSKSEEENDSISSMKEHLMVSELCNKNFIISNRVDHPDNIGSPHEKEYDPALVINTKTTLRENVNTADKEQYSIPSCSNSNCSASWCSICSFSSKYNSTKCCSLCNCTLQSLNNEIFLVRSISLPSKCEVIEDILTHLPNYIERSSSCKVTKNEISDNQKLDFYQIN